MKVLVVEDDRALREVMSKTVARWGYETQTAADGLLALEALKDPDPAQIILLDLMMPNMDGVEACRRITFMYPDACYIIILTALSSRENFARAMEAGAHDFLAKPVDMAELKCRLAVGRRLMQSEEVARRNHFFLEAAAEGAGLGMWEINVAAGTGRVNRHICQMTGLPSEEITVADWLALVHDEDYSSVKARLVDRKGLGDDAEYRIRAADGNWRWVLVRGKVIKEDGQGKPGLVCGSLQDITDRVERENRMFEAERLAAVHTLAAGVAHNFNNLNTGINGNLQLILGDGSLTPQVKQWASRALDASKRISAITASLQRLSSQRDGAPLARHSLRLIVEDVLAFLQNTLEENRIHLVLHLEESAEVNCDPGALAQAVFILIDNAMHALAGRPDRIITISCHQFEERVQLRVADNGCGIPHEDLRKIFSPFFSTKGEHAPRGSYMGNFRGMGVGLFTMNNIIRWHSGEVYVESSLGEGTSFTILLPLPEVPPAG